MRPCSPVKLSISVILCYRIPVSEVRVNFVQWYGLGVHVAAPMSSAQMAPR